MGAAWAVLPLAMTLMVVGVASAGAQGGIRVATKLFVPEVQPAQPAARDQADVRPAGALGGLTKALVKTTVLGAVLYMTTKDIIPILMTAGQLPLGSLLARGQRRGARR